jgi:hypothetical protein
MSPMLDEMLVYEVVPRLRNVARTIPKIGHEDDEEILQETTLMAARMMDSAEKALAEVKAIIEGSKRVDGKLPASTVKKLEKFLKDAVV